MIITITGRIGSGKTTVAKDVAKQLGMEFISMGDLWTKLAQKEGLTTYQLNKEAEKNKKYDKKIDDMVKELGKTRDNFVIDCRLGFHFIPKSFKIFLSVDLDVATERIFKDKRPDETENTTIAATRERIQQREASEAVRYDSLYGLNPASEKNYDLKIDTSEKSIEEIARIIIDNAIKA